MLASFLFVVSAIVIRVTERDCEQDYYDIMREHAIESMEHYNNTLMRHGSMATLVPMPPMPLSTVMHNVFPPGYQPFPHMPGDRTYAQDNCNEDTFTFHKLGGKDDLDEAKL